MGWGGREVQEGGACVYLWLIHAGVWQKPTQRYKAITLQLKINKLKKCGVAKHSFKMILISSSGQGSPDRGSPGLSGRSGWFFLRPATCPDPRSSVWAVSSLGRGIPESQGIPNPSESGAFHPTPPVAGPARVSGFQAAALRPLAGPVPPFQELLSLGFPRKTMPHSC